jgi:hypothetical protein
MLSPEPTLLMSAIGPNETRHSSLLNWSICFFFCFQQELLAPYSILVRTHFGDSAGESTNSTMKKEDPDTTGSDLNKNNIFNPTLDHLSAEDRRALEAYHKEVDEIFLSC